MPPKKTFVYIDSFNMYYGILKKIPNGKWLDVNSWLSKVMPHNYTLDRIKYFTANVSASPHDLQKPVRQSIYFRALATLPNVELIKGRFKNKTVNLQLNKDIKILGRVPEEKGTDVNLGVHLVNDAHLGVFDTAVVVSNDSDIAEAVNIVARDLGKEVWVLNPCYQNPPSRELTQHASQIRIARETTIRTSQFNPTLTDATGSFFKPSTW